MQLEAAVEIATANLKEMDLDQSASMKFQVYTFSRISIANLVQKLQQSKSHNKDHFKTPLRLSTSDIILPLYQKYQHWNQRNYSKGFLPHIFSEGKKISLCQYYQSKVSQIHYTSLSIHHIQISIPRWRHDKSDISYIYQSSYCIRLKTN